MIRFKPLNTKSTSGEPLILKLEDLKNRQDRTDRYLYAVIIALFIGFSTIFVAVAAMLTDVWSGKEQSLKEY